MSFSDEDADDLLTGINMLIFELTAGRVIHRWDQSPSALPVGKAVAALSPVIRISIICMGRNRWLPHQSGDRDSRTPRRINFDNSLRQRRRTAAQPQPRLHRQSDYK
jgi:hypothetical protein